MLFIRVAANPAADRSGPPYPALCFITQVAYHARNASVGARKEALPEELCSATTRRVSLTDTPWARTYAGESERSGVESDNPSFARRTSQGDGR